MTEEVIKIYHEDLPRRKNSKNIDWNEAIGTNIKFQCIDVIGEFIIKKIYRDKVKNFITHIDLQYNDDIHKLRYGSFLKSQIKTIFYPYDFNYKIGQRIVDEKKDITIIKLKTRFEKKYNRHVKVCEFHCNKCSYDGEKDESCIDKCVCPVCGTNSYVVVPGINDIPTTDPWMIPYFQGGYEEAKLYSYGSYKRIYPICPDCGRVKEHSMYINAIHQHRSIGCKCSDGISYPEKFFVSLLEQLGINYKWQLNRDDFEWCSKYRYDFYLIDYNYIVELHGEQHYKEVKFFSKNNIKQSETDEMKKDNAIQYVDKYIEIDCRNSDLEWLKTNIENSLLSKIFNLAKVDYIKCEEFACKNIVKEICEYYENNKTIMLYEIANVYKLSPITIRRYLKKGHKIGWCNYDASENRKNGLQKANEHSRKYVELYKDDQFVISYNSLQELDKFSLRDLGVKLCAGTVGKKYKNNETYQGYTLKVYSYKELEN